MADHWIKITTNLHEKPEVVAISNELGIDRFSVTGRLLRIWSWFDAHSTDGHANGVTSVFIDDLVSCDGFANALRKVDWLVDRSGSLLVPRFDRHNGQSAKKRAENTVRKQKSRQTKSHANNVTDARPEKRREEKEKVKKEKSSKARAGSQAEVVEYVIAQGLPESDGVYLWNNWEASGWMRGKQPIKDWKAVVRSWKSAGFLPSLQQQNAGPTHNQRGDYLKKQRQQMLKEMGEK